jgi:hypothetical protein
MKKCFYLSIKNKNKINHLVNLEEELVQEDIFNLKM